MFVSPSQRAVHWFVVAASELAIVVLLRQECVTALRLGW